MASPSSLLSSTEVSDDFLPLPIPKRAALRLKTRFPSRYVCTASDFLVEVFGEKGKHARSAVGTNALPLNVPVEIEAVVEYTE